MDGVGRHVMVFSVFACGVERGLLVTGKKGGIGVVVSVAEGLEQFAVSEVFKVRVVCVT